MCSVDAEYSVNCSRYYLQSMCYQPKGSFGVWDNGCKGSYSGLCLMAVIILHLFLEVLY